MFEILDMIESAAREEKRKRKEKILDGFILAEAVAWNLAVLLPHDEKIKPPKPWDYYRSFEEEKEAFEKQDQGRQLEEYKEKRREYAAEVNRRRQQGLL